MHENNLSQINFDVKNILSIGFDYKQGIDLTENIPINQYLEITDEINRLNLNNTGELVQDISHILKTDDVNLKGIGLACIASIHTYNGNYTKAGMAIDRALKLKVTNTVYAYILSEYGNLLRQLQRTDAALAVLEKALQLTDNEKLKWRITTYKGYASKYRNKDHALELLESASQYYLNNNEYARYVIIIRHIGSTHIVNNEFNKAKKMISYAKHMAEHYSLPALLSNIKIDESWLCIKQKRYEIARTLLLKLLANDLTPYQKSLALQNLAVLEFKCENYTDVIKYHKKSLRLTTKYGMNEMLFEDFYRLGLAHEKIGNYGKAEKYYSRGYQYLQNERKALGIILTTGYRNELVDAYLLFLANKPSILFAADRAETFSFIEGKTYREIKETIQNPLFTLHRSRYKTPQELCQNIGISVRLYFNFQKKFGRSKDGQPKNLPKNRHFSNYINSLSLLDWKSANLKFDRDLFKYLLPRNQFNKTKVANLLGVTRITVINKSANIV